MIDTILGFAGVTALTILGVYIYLTRRKIRKYEEKLHAAVQFMDGQVETLAKFISAAKTVLDRHKIDRSELIDEIKNIK